MQCKCKAICDCEPFSSLFSQNQVDWTIKLEGDFPMQMQRISLTSKHGTTSSEIEKCGIVDYSSFSELSR